MGAVCDNDDDDDDADYRHLSTSHHWSFIRKFVFNRCLTDTSYLLWTPVKGGVYTGL